MIKRTDTKHKKDTLSAWARWLGTGGVAELSWVY